MGRGLLRVPSKPRSCRRQFTSAGTSAREKPGSETCHRARTCLHPARFPNCPQTTPFTHRIRAPAVSFALTRSGQRRSSVAAISHVMRPRLRNSRLRFRKGYEPAGRQHLRSGLGGRCSAAPRPLRPAHARRLASLPPRSQCSHVEPSVRRDGAPATRRPPALCRPPDVVRPSPHPRARSRVMSAPSPSASGATVQPWGAGRLLLRVERPRCCCSWRADHPRRPNSDASPTRSARPVVSGATWSTSRGAGGGWARELPVRRGQSQRSPHNPVSRVTEHPIG